MLCKEVIRKLSDYLDGELEPDLAAQLTRHLEHCEDCRLVIDTTRKTVEIFCKTEPAPLPEDVLHRLNRLLSAKLGQRRIPPE